MASDNQPMSKTLPFESQEDLINSDKFINKAALYMEDVWGEELSLDNEEAVEQIYSKMRDLDVNLLTAERFWNKLGELDDDQKSNVRYVYDVYRSMPTMFEDDSVSKFDAFVDYGIGIATDIPTIASMFAGRRGIKKNLQARVAVTGAIQAALKNAAKVGLSKPVLTAGVIDAVGMFSHDAYIQGAEKELNLREDYSLTQGVLTTGLGLGVGVVAGKLGESIGKGINFSRGKIAKTETGDYLGVREFDVSSAILEGQENILKGSDIGRAFLDNKVTEGSFVRLSTPRQKSLDEGNIVDALSPMRNDLKDLGYVTEIDTKKGEYTITTGFTDVTSDPITKVVKKDEVVLENPFSNLVQKKMRQDVFKATTTYNTARAKEGFDDLQEITKKFLGNDLNMDQLMTSNQQSNINAAYAEMFVKSKMIYNPNKNITQHIADMIREQPNGFNNDAFKEVLESNLVSQEDFARFMAGAYEGSIGQGARLMRAQRTMKKALDKEFREALGGEFAQNYRKAMAGIKTDSRYKELFEGFDDKKLSTDETVAALLNIKNPVSPAQSKYYIDMLAERNRESGWWKYQTKEALTGGQERNVRSLTDQWNRMVRLGMTAMPATTTRNVVGAIIRTPLDGTTRVFDNIITSTINRVSGGPQIRPTRLLDGFDHVNSMFNPIENKALFDFLATQKPEIKKMLLGPEGLMEAAQVVQALEATKKGSNGFLSKIFLGTDVIEKGLMNLNILNHIQDRYFKANAFSVGLRHAMERDGLDMLRLIKEGKIDSVDSKYFEEAMEWAVEFNFQSDFTKGRGLGAEAAKVATSLSNLPLVGPTILPFPKFFLNAMKYTYQHIPVVGLFDSVSGDTTIGGMFTKLGSKKATSYQKQQVIKGISRNLSGTALLTTAYAIRNSEYAVPEQWNMVRDYDGAKVDISSYYPLAPYLWLAEVIDQYLESPSSSDKGIDEYQLTRNSFSEELLSDAGRALGGPSSRSSLLALFTPKTMQSMSEAFNENNSVAWNYTLGKLGEIVAHNLASPIMTGFKFPKDVWAEFTQDEKIRAFKTGRSSGGFMENFVGEILRNIPGYDQSLEYADHGIRYNKKGNIVIDNKLQQVPRNKRKGIPRYLYSGFNKEPIKNVAPLWKHFTGSVRYRKGNKVEEHLDELGLQNYKLFRRTRVPEYDQALKLASSEIMFHTLSRFINSPKYRGIKNIDSRKTYVKRRIDLTKEEIVKHVMSKTSVNLEKKFATANSKFRSNAIRLLRNRGLMDSDGNLLDVDADFNTMHPSVLKVLIEVGNGLKKGLDKY